MNKSLYTNNSGKLVKISENICCEEVEIWNGCSEIGILETE